jgi:hypothetical protein
MILDELVTLMVADVDVNALIAGRIYTEVAPEGTAVPYVIQALINEGRLVVLEGGAATQNPNRVQLDCYDDNFDDALDLSNKMETAIVGAGTFAVGELSRQTNYDTQTRLYRIMLDVSLWT